MLSEIKVGSFVIDVYGQYGKVLELDWDRDKALVKYNDARKWRDINSLLITDE